MIQLVPVSFENLVHMKWWHDIRNHDTVRATARTAHRIKIEEHRAWWLASKKNAQRKLFFIRVVRDQFQPQVVGIARLDHRGAWTEVSIALLPEWRGQGLGKDTVLQLGQVRRGLKWPPLGAVVNGKNLASLRLFIKLGFTLRKAGFVQLTQQEGRRG